jgi:glycosyltransferase involved in cell wall biosynthesis
MNLISIVIPCYNQAHFLSEAIESVLAQTYSNFEIVVVDDGSVDNTSEVAVHYSGVRLIRQKNQGSGAARNKGFQLCKGKYIVFLDSDDRLLPKALEISLKFLENHPECAFSYGHVKLITSDGSPLPIPPQSCIEKDHYYKLLQHNYIWNPSVQMFRRDILKSVGGFDASLRRAQDFELNLRITKKYPIICIDKAIAEYRYHEQNISQNYGRQLKFTALVMQKQLQYVRGNRQLMNAYREGSYETENYYGNIMINEIRGNLHEYKIMSALRNMIVLLWYNPNILIKSISPKLYNIIYIFKDFLSNRKFKSQRTTRGRSADFIRACPNPITIHQTSASSFQLILSDQVIPLGRTSLSWSSKNAEVVEVHVNAPDGPLFYRGNPEGCAITEKWVTDGMIFYLQDVSGGKPLSKSNTLAVVTVNVFSKLFKKRNIILILI